jgi:maltose O-acetyltransferase
MMAHIRGLVLRFAGLALVPRNLRWLLLTAVGLRLKTRQIAPGSLFTGPDVAIGRGSFVNTMCLFDAWAPITLGNRVAVGMGVLFATSTHKLGPSGARAGPLDVAPITVGDGVWIGARAVLLPGVSVGSGCVIAAGAVVTEDCAPDGLYAGVPARRIRDLDEGLGAATA